MRVAICTDPVNKAGLERDYNLLRNLIRGAGHGVTPVHHRRPKPRERFDLVIFCETYVPGWEDLAPVRWAIPNPEWWFWDDAVPIFDRVLCKTRDAERIFGGLGGNVVYTGFEATSRLDPSIQRERAFLHVGGKSTTKGTKAVIAAWERFAIPHPLHVVSQRTPRAASRGARPSPAIRAWGRLQDVELRRLQNRCLFHIQPSEYEGFGHVVWEGLSVGAVVAVTGAPPLDEIRSAIKIPPAAFRSMQSAQVADVSQEAIRDAAEAMLALSDDDVRVRAVEGRAEYEAMVAAFRRTMLGMLGTL